MPYWSFCLLKSQHALVTVTGAALNSDADNKTTVDEKQSVPSFNQKRTVL